MRLDPQGELVSATLFGDPEAPIHRVAASPGGLMATLGSLGNGDAMLSVLDASGQALYNQTFVGAGVGSVAVVDEGVIVQLPISEATIIGDGAFPSEVPHQAAVAKFDRGGQLVWKRAFGSDYQSSLSGMDVDSSGNVALSGWVSMLLDESFAFDSVAVPKTSASVLGMAYVGVLDAEGQARWVRRLAGVTSGYGPPQAALDAAGVVRVMGLDPDHDALFVAQYGP